LNKKQWRILLSILVVAAVAVGVAVGVANFKPGPSDAIKKVAVEVKAVYELDIQLASVARFGTANSANSGVRTYSAELQDFAQTQKQKLHDWFNKHGLKLEDVSVSTEVSLTLPHGYQQQLAKTTGTDFDAYLNHYLTDMEAFLAKVDTKTRFVDKNVVNEFKQVKGEVSGVKNLIF
jgi:predicted outer membrane protein